MTVIMPNPSVLEHFHAERQRRLRPRPAPGAKHTPTHAGIRVRLGRALIGAGIALGGERVEPARRSTQPRAV